MKNNNHLVSIITISYNVVSSIEATILSVINQTYLPIEYIIIDGGSVDGTLDIIKKYTDRITYWCSEPDKGIYDAMNKGIAKATGEWVNFMNAGDTFFDFFVIEKLFARISFKSHIVYGNTMMMLKVGNYIEYPKSLNLISKQMVFGHQATFVRRQVLNKLKFNISFKSSGDYDFFLRAYKEGFNFEYIPITVANYEGESGISMKKYLLARREDARIQGNDHKLIWRINFFFFCVMYKIKKIVKTILPQNVVYNIQLKNANKRYK